MLNLHERGTVRSLQVVVVGALLLAACSDGADESVGSVGDDDLLLAQEVPDSALRTFRWIDTDVVDLNSADGTFIRAAVESWWLARNREDLDAGYPGFGDAMRDANFRYEGFARPPEDTIIGTNYFQIVGLDERSDGVTQAWYCPIVNLSGTTTNYDPDAPGPFLVGSGNETTSVFPLLYRRTPGEDGVEQVPPSLMEGPEKAPSTDVFGSWMVVSTNLGADNSTKPSVEACESKAPGTPPEWGPGVQYSDTPPVAQPPYPGWPNDGS